MLEDDLVDTCKPGGRISVVGVYKAIPPRASGQVGGLFKAVVVGNSVRQLSREADRDLTADDIRCACLPRSTALALLSSQYGWPCRFNVVARHAQVWATAHHHLRMLYLQHHMTLLCTPIPVLLCSSRPWAVALQECTSPSS